MKEGGREMRQGGREMREGGREGGREANEGRRVMSNLNKDGEENKSCDGSEHALTQLQFFRELVIMGALQFRLLWDPDKCQSKGHSSSQTTVALQWAETHYNGRYWNACTLRNRDFSSMANKTRHYVTITSLFLHSTIKLMPFRFSSYFTCNKGHYQSQHSLPCRWCWNST